MQDAVAAALGEAAAWKVGGGGTRAPIAAPLVRSSPCRWPASDFLRTAVEAEIAFRIGRDLGFGAGSPGEDEIRAAISGIHAAIEVVDSRYDTWPVPDALAALADNQSNGGLVVSPEGRPWDGRALGEAELVLTADGRSLYSGLGRNPGGEPFLLLCRLAAELADRGLGLRAGTLVTTGSLNGIIFVEPGAEIVAEIRDVGRVELTLAG